MILTYQYSKETQRAIHIAQSLAREYKNEHFSPAHLLMAILHNDIGLASYLATLGKDIHYLREWAEYRIEDYPKTSKVIDEPTGDNKVRVLFEVADLVKLKFAEDSISPLVLLAAIVRPNVVFNKEQLKSFTLSESELIKANLDQQSTHKAIDYKSNGVAEENLPGVSGVLKYCIDKTALAREGKLDPIVGRDRETRMIAEILGRRTKPNVIVVGEPGVGKTALVEGLANNIIANRVPPHLKDAYIMELDVGALIAGASYKGEIEDRLKIIIKEIKLFDRAILFIDEIHALLDSKTGMGGAANLLKPELARGEITVIGATTNDEYREFLEADEAFNRRFELLRLEEPDAATAVRMINTLVPYYEEHHGLIVEKKAVELAVGLAKRYLKDRRLPDSAIDLMDRTMASIKMMSETSSEELDALSLGLSQLTDAFKEETEEEKTKELLWFFTQLKHSISPVLMNQLDDKTEVEKLTSAEAITEYLKSAIAALQGLCQNKKETVDPQDIAAVVSHKTGIPLGKIQAQEREKLLHLEDVLRKRVVGQDHALKVIGDAILESRSGLLKQGQPIGSFFFMGPTGTGKTELAKSLAEFLFNDEQALIRFDMSEFKEEHSAALLYGAPPGYVGYKEGGLLVNKIRQQPYSVVLFDEIEKAHPSVFDIFLQILDEGKLHDRLGKEGDFSNAIILFTSNIGSEFVEEQFGKGEIPSNTRLLELMGRYFRPEFLGRLTEIVPFSPITEEVVLRIFDIQLKKLIEMSSKQGISLELTEETRKQLARDGFTPKYGARPLKGVIRNRLRRPISKLIISGQLQKGNKLSIGLGKDNSLKWNISQ